MNFISAAVLFAVKLAVNLLLIGSLVAGSLAISFRLLKNISPRVRYVISVVAFLIVVVMPLAFSLDSSRERISLPMIAGTKFKSVVENSSEQNDVLNEGATSRGSSEAAEIALTDSLNAFTLFAANSSLGNIFFSLWIVGAACFLCLDGIAHWRLRKTLKAWKPATHSERKELLCPEGVPLYFDEYQSPGTVGFFNPAIVLPQRFSKDLPLDSRRYIVQHEAAHALWRDPLVNSLFRLLRSIFWVCPALWLLERFANAEREAAADRAVILKFSANKSEFEATSIKYATTLVAVAKQFGSPGRHNHYWPQTTGIGGGTGLENRVRRLLADSAQTTLFHLAFAAVIFIISLAALTVMPLASQPSQSSVVSSGMEKKMLSPLVEEKSGRTLFDEKVIRDSGIIGGQEREVKSSVVGSRSKPDSSSPLNVDRNKAGVTGSISEELSLISPESEESMTSLNASINTLNRKLQELGARNSRLEQESNDLEAGAGQLQLKHSLNSNKLGILF